MAGTPPQIPLPPVRIPDPELGRARRNALINIREANGQEVQESVYLLNASPEVTQAYQVYHGRQIPLAGRGEIRFARMYHREQRDDGRVVFHRTPESLETMVVIKKLRRWVIDPEVAANCNENPYNEVSVMREFGNYRNLMKCYEALKDDKYLYIIIMYLPGGDLYQSIHWGTGGGYFPTEDIPMVARKLVENLLHLRMSKLVHRDIKPENVMIFPPWFPKIDPAMALQCMFLEGNPQLIIPPNGAAGSPSYISPEVFQNVPFNHKADTWAVGSIIFNLFTGFRLYKIPSQEDQCFDFFITRRGLSDEGLCDRHLEENIQYAEIDPICQRIIALQHVGSETRALLQQLLSTDPRGRPEVEGILQHPLFAQEQQVQPQEIPSARQH